MKQGEVPESRHTYDSRDKVYREELFGEESFEGPYSLIYHRSEPTRVASMEDLNKEQFKRSGNFKHRHMLFDTQKLQREGDIVSGRQYLLYNDNLRLGVTKPSKEFKSYFRSATSEILMYIQKGSGKLSSSFGTLEFTERDYLYIPKGTTCSFSYSNDLEIFFVESFDRISIPSRYLNLYGQLLEGTPYYNRDFRAPDLFADFVNPVERNVLVDYDDIYVLEKRNENFYDTVGWDGYLYPFAISVDRMAPIVGRLHQPPPVHETFSGKTFMVGTFLPRLFDFHPRSIPISYYHNNIDTDEILFYSSGNFMSRKGISEGSITLHARGLIHGPQPGMIEEAIGKKETNEVAIMIEAYGSLVPTERAEIISNPDYMKSWK